MNKPISDKLANRLLDTLCTKDNNPRVRFVEASLFLEFDMKAKILTCRLSDVINGEDVFVDVVFTVPVCRAGTATMNGLYRKIEIE